MGERVFATDDHGDIDTQNRNEEYEIEDTSAETAGATRGFLRTLSSRIANGNWFPKKAPNPKLPTIPKVSGSSKSASNIVTRVIRERRGARIAKVSDAASTGLDVVDVVTSTLPEQESSSKNDKSTQNTQRKKESGDKKFTNVRNWNETYFKYVRIIGSACFIYLIFFDNLVNLKSEKFRWQF